MSDYKEELIKICQEAFDKVTEIQQSNDELKGSTQSELGFKLSLLRYLLNEAINTAVNIKDSNVVLQSKVF